MILMQHKNLSTKRRIHFTVQYMYVYVTSNDEPKFNKFSSNNYAPISILTAACMFVEARMYKCLSLITHEQFMYVKIKHTM